MSKNLKVSYILFFIFAGILVAWNTLSNFFGGMALNFVALLGITFTVTLLTLSDKSLLKQVKDVFIVSCVFCFLEIIIYFACEFGYGEQLKGFIVYQNIISFFGLLFLAYIGFRFAISVSNKKIKFIEIMLGNEKKTPKQKKAKEISNGSLEEKPNQKVEEKNKNFENTVKDYNSQEVEIIIAEDEE